MPLKLNNPVNIKTGFVAELLNQGEDVQILSITFRMTEKTALVEYRIPSTDGTRDHRNAVTLPFKDLPKNKIKAILTDVYAELAKLPVLGAGTVTDDNV